MNESTSISYSYTNINNEISKKIEYKSTIADKDNKKILSTMYNNNIVNNNGVENITESFNKFIKDDTDNGKIYEQIGNSKNRNNWDIKEFDNHVLNNEYRENYNKISFKPILDKVPDLLELPSNKNTTNLPMITND